MADTKIKDLTDGSTAVSSDRIPVTRDPTGTPVNRYITPGYITTAVLAAIPVSDGVSNGLMSPAQHTKLAGIETGATADMTGAEIAAAITAGALTLVSSLFHVATNGSAAAPSIARSNDTDTGIFFPAANQMAGAIGGVEAMRITNHATTAKPQVIIGATSVQGFAMLGIQNTQAFEAIAINAPSRASGTPNNDANGYIRFIDGVNGSTFSFGGYNDTLGNPSSKNILFDAANNYNIRFSHATANILQLTYTGNVVIGASAIATNATDGFLYLPSCAGTPSGTPTAYTGRVAFVYDTSANKLWAYNGSWRQTAALT